MKQTLNSLITLVLAAYLLVACQPGQSQPATPLANTLVFIFENYTPTSIKKRIQHHSDAPHDYALSHRDDHGLPRFFLPRQPSDTLEVKTRRHWMEVEHLVNGIDRYRYLFQAGDTVLFQYDGSLPKARVLNRPVADIEANYSYLMRQRVGAEQVPALTKHKAPFLFMDGIEGTFQQRVALVKAQALSKAAQELRDEADWLDSLSRAGGLSPVALAYRRGILDWKQQRFQTYTDTSALAIRLAAVQRQRRRPDWDSLLYFSHHRGQLRTFFWHRIASQAPEIEGSHYRGPDHRWIVREIMADDSLSEREKQMLLIQEAPMAVEQCSAQELNRLFEQLRAKLSDSVVVAYWAERYQMDQEVSQDLALIDASQASTDWKTARREMQGQVLYVDFWASWCAPCLRAMPAAAELREHLAGEDVVFAYISMDENPEAWAKASQRLGFDSLAHSYRISNRRTSLFLEEMDISTIPRYLIYDRAGKLVYPRAPGPDDARIEQILRDLAEE